MVLLPFILFPMRKFLIFLFITFSSLCNAQEMTKQTETALNSIFHGYIEYGVNELKKASALNDITAQYYLALCYENGIVFTQDLLESFKLYRCTAERGLPDGMYKLSTFYNNGTVVAKNTSKGVEWYSRFQKKGGINILPNFTLIYKEGLKNSANYALNPDKTAAGNGTTDNDYAQTNVNNKNQSINSNNQTINNITIIQQNSSSQTRNESLDRNAQPTEKKSDVDVNIPSFINSNDNTFALIIANENYQDVAKVSNAINDGEAFGKYCNQTLGLPSSNTFFVKDATLNNIKREVTRLGQVAEAYKGSAKIIFYYAGHGIPDESSKNAFILPVDGYGTDTSTGYSLNDLYTSLGNMPAEHIIVFLDACFSGSLRGEGMLTSARGIAIKAKPNVPKGKMVVFSAAQGNETAFPFKEQNHGLFTYYLLKKLKETKGNVSLGELSTYITDNVRKKSIIINGKSQTPTTSASPIVGGSWRNWTLK